MREEVRSLTGVLSSSPPSPSGSSTSKRNVVKMRLKGFDILHEWQLR